MRAYEDESVGVDSTVRSACCAARSLQRERQERGDSLPHRPRKAENACRGQRALWGHPRGRNGSKRHGFENLAGGTKEGVVDPGCVRACSDSSRARGARRRSNVHEVHNPIVKGLTMKMLGGRSAGHAHNRRIFGRISDVNSLCREGRHFGMPPTAPITPTFRRSGGAQRAKKKTRRDPLSLPSATRRVTKRSTPPQRRRTSLET
jgi:hypothetical protein